MERDSRRDNFGKRNRLNIIARSVAAISIATAGAAVVEESDVLDPLAGSIESANHLVLKTPHKAYEQLIDELLEVEKARAAAVQKTCYKSFYAMTPNYNCTGTNMPVAVGDHISIYYEDAAFFDHICHSNVTAAGEFEITANVQVNDPQNDDCDQFGTPPDNPVTIDVCNSTPDPAPEMSGNQLAINAACDIPSVGGVGGIAEAPDLSDLPQNMNSQKSKDNALPIAAGAAAVIGAISATGVVLYINRRRRSS